AGDVTVIGVSGRLTLGDPVFSLRETLATVSAAGHDNVILHLGGLDYIDSAGLGELIQATKRFSLKLVNVPKRVIDLMQLSKTYPLFKIHPDEESAIAGFQQNAEKGKRA